MTYDKGSWGTYAWDPSKSREENLLSAERLGAAVTKSKMDNIEDGIADAHIKNRELEQVKADKVDLQNLDNKKADNDRVDSLEQSKADITYVESMAEGQVNNIDFENARREDNNYVVNEIDRLDKKKADKDKLEKDIGNVTTQLDQKANEVEVYLKQNGININDFDEQTRQTFLEAQEIDVNYVLGEGNVTPSNTTFLYPSPTNIYDYRTNTENIRFTSAGQVVTDEGNSSSDYIKVSEGRYVVALPNITEETTKLLRIPFFDSSKEFISIAHGGISAPTNSVTLEIPADGFIRVSPKKEFVREVVVAREEDYIGYLPFAWVTDIQAKPLADSVGKDELIKGSISYDHTNFIVRGKNLFDKENVELNKFYSMFPSTTELSGYYVTKSPISLKGDTDYTIQKIRQYYLTDIAGRVVDIDNTGDNEATVTITTPPEGVLLYMSGSIVNLDKTQVEEGTEATEVEEQRVDIPDLTLTESQISAVAENIKIEPGEINTGLLAVEKNGEDFYLTSKLSDSDKITIHTQRHGRNNAFNFINTKLNDLMVHNNGDDIAPIRTFATVGANHGYTTIIIVSMTNHGKNTDDLGSVWTDGDTEYTLLQVDGDNLTFGCPYTVDSNGSVTSRRTLPTSELTHLRNATNTEKIDSETVNIGQLYPSINKISVKYLLDGKEIREDGVHHGDKLTIQESYNIMDYKSIMDTAQSNVGVPYEELDVEGVARISNTYSFGEGLKCTTSHSLLALKPIKLARSGFLQSGRMNASNHTLERYMPNVKEKEGWDFANGVNLDDYSENLVFKHEDSINPDVPPSYTVDWLIDSNDNKKIGFSMGYIVDKTNSRNSDRLNNSPNTWDMRGTGKNYPIAVEGINLEQGEYLNFQGFRNYVHPTQIFVEVLDNKNNYLYGILDEGTHFHELPDNIGDEVLVLQSDGWSTLNDTVDSSGVVVRSDKGNGSGILKIS